MAEETVEGVRNVADGTKQVVERLRRRGASFAEVDAVD